MTSPLYIPTPDEGCCGLCGVELGTGLTKVEESAIEGVCKSCAFMMDARYSKEKRPHYATLKEDWR